MRLLLGVAQVSWILTIALMVILWCMAFFAVVTESWQIVGLLVTIFYMWIMVIFVGVTTTVITESRKMGRK